MGKRAALERFARYIRSINRSDAVFIWIPKTAGTSIYKVLANYGCQRLKNTRLVEEAFPNKGLATFVHMDYQKLVETGYIPKQFDQNSFKFCFCRNPYSRSVSLFFYLKKVNKMQQDVSFIDFCRVLMEIEIPDIGLYNTCGKMYVDGKFYTSLSLCNPQIRWIRGIDVDYIGRLENLESDLDHILDQLGLRRTRKVPAENTTNHQGYRKYYCKESKAIIENLYEPDFKRFNYSFENWL